MSISAANPAGFSHLSSVPGGAGEQEPFDAQLRWRIALLLTAEMPARIALQLRWTSAANAQMRTLLWSVSAVMYPVFCSVTASGPFRRPAALGLLLRILRPFGVSVPPKTSLRTTAKNAAQTSFGPLPESRPSALGSRAHSLSSAQCDPSNNGKFNKRRHYHVPEQSNPHRLPRQQPRSSHQQTTAASPLSRWQPSPPTRRTASTSRTPNGTVASSSASSRSSPRRSPRAHISRWKANCAAGSTTARRRTRSSASGKFGSLRS